ncbi:2Fe-2S iron-sulfur cluster-binding protein [Candidatus Similichlamydia epinepheli]|uniref:2Fe-2S iron-sulfur cluster-binding protein n=1 Tax=Candidatus Similichlamydia epinepheli TaxID=1903953 RepID=UPI001300B584|nr:2Fe-2S iron-sulfur cluster-binding protein [Candidatus Similichlamydia epinepheli]
MGKVVFKTSNVEVEVEDNTNLQKVCSQHGVLFGCRSGGCGTCIVQIISGQENLNPPTEAELDFFCDEVGGERLACQITLLHGEVTIL